MLKGVMRLAWRIFVVVGLALLLYICVPKWLNRGLGYGDYGYAGGMICIMWFGFYLAALISAIPDSSFSRLLLGSGTTLAVPPLCYHIYDATGAPQTVANLVLLVGFTTYAYSQLVMKPREERLRQLERQGRDELN